MSYKNLAWFTIGNTPSTSGNFTVSSAVDSLHVTLGAADDGLSFSARIFEAGVGSEVRTGCTYTHGTTTLTRGTLESSTSGSALNFTSAAQVQILGATSASATLLEIAMQSIIPGGRLTTESGVPVSTSDRTSQSTIYYTPFVHNRIPLWDGSQWKPLIFAETSLALSGLTSGKPYDVFGYISSGSLALELLVWTDDTTRATAVTLQDGRYCKSGDKTRLLLGTIYTTSTSTTEDSQTNRYVANVYNAVPLRMFSCPAYADNNAVTSYTHTSTTWSEANGGTGSRVNYVLPLPAMVSIGVQAVGDPAATFSIGAAVGNDSATSANIELLGVSSTRISASTVARFQKSPGKHFGALLLRVSSGTGTIYADNNRSGGSSDPALTHIHGEVSA